MTTKKTTTTAHRPFVLGMLTLPLPVAALPIPAAPWPYHFMAGPDIDTLEDSAGEGRPISNNPMIQLENELIGVSRR